MKKITLTFKFLIIWLFAQSQSVGDIDYSVQMLNADINKPGYSAYNASMNDNQNKLCFVRRGWYSHFAEIWIAERAGNGDWAEPKKIYPQKEKVLKWNKNKSRGNNSGQLTYPDYEIGFELNETDIDGNELRYLSPVEIRPCKINNQGNAILFAVTFRRNDNSKVNVCSLTQNTNGSWVFNIVEINTFYIYSINDFSSDGEWFVGFISDGNSGQKHSLFKRDKIGNFANLGHKLVPSGVIANDNSTAFEGKYDKRFKRYMDFNGHTNSDGIWPHYESNQELDFKEGKISWLSKDIQSGLFYTENKKRENNTEVIRSQVGFFTVQSPIQFEDAQAVKLGWMKPWRGQQSVSQRNNPVIIDDKPKIVKPTGKYYALVIGVSQYDDPSLGSLSRPRQDAQKLRDILVSKYEFNVNETSLLVDATREQILTEFNRLRKTITPNDNLLIFYAGHGKWDESVKQGYWLPRNASLNNEANWISNSDIKEQIRAIQSGHTLLISDACFSGGIFRSRSAESIRTADYDIIALYKMPSRRAMTSGTMSTVPDNSVFFDYLTKRLSENEEKFLPSTTLFDSFRRAVINNTKMVVPQDGVIAETGDEGGDFIFIKRD